MYVFQVLTCFLLPQQEYQPINPGKTIFQKQINKIIMKFDLPISGQQLSQYFL